MAYKLAYAPGFARDLDGALDHILTVLQNPIAARALVDKLERAVLTVQRFPLASPPYPSQKARPLPYYRVQVGNYAAFYVVRGDTVEFRRFLYARSDLPARLEE